MFSFSEIVWHNVKEHATLSAGAHFDHGVDVETTGEHVNRAADRGCVSRLVELSRCAGSLIGGLVMWHGVNER